MRNFRTRYAATLGLAATLILACSHADNPPDKPTTKALALEDVGLSTTALDKSVDPCDDFYQYACGGWLAKTEIPSDQSRWGRSFSEIRKSNELEMKALLEDAAKQVAAGSASEPRTQAMGAYYAACTDQSAIEGAGLGPVDALLSTAKQVKTPDEIAEVITVLHSLGFHAVFKVDIDQDFKAPQKITTYFEQSGLGLPDRDYYLSDRFAPKLAAYRTYIQKLFVLAGASETEAQKAQKDIVEFETALAKASVSRVEMRNLPARYNKVDRKGIAALTPNFNWDRYLLKSGVAELQDISVTSKEFFTAFNSLLLRPAAVWSHYLQWVILRSTARVLPNPFTDARFAMTQALTGQKTEQPRWKQCVAATDKALREYTGRAFVERRFAGHAKQAVTDMINGISEAFATEVTGYDWMDAKTKEQALAKRAKMTYLVGYPDDWKTYDFTLDPKQFAANWLAAKQHAVSMEWRKTKQPVNKRDWSWSAAMVNAGYHPLRNSMIYPAGILQPPFYSPKATLAVNLGGLGMVVGHELTHGFDDSGARFDANGSMKNWWSKEVATQFDAKKQCLVEQYNGYEALPGQKVNGKLTLGENIADLGGVKLAFKAYRAKRKNASDPIVAGGFTEDQQFFLAVGQTWCSKSTDESTQMLLQTDPHSPPKFRVRGALSSLPEFAEAFQCTAGSAMNPNERCTVW